MVDVADVSAMHVRALERPETAGRRYIASAGSVTMPKIARHLRGRFPGRKIATRVAPRFVLRLLSLVDPSMRRILPALGTMPVFDTGRARDEPGIAFTDWRTAVDLSAAAVIALKR